MQNKVRKIIAVIAALALLTAFAACGQPKDDPTTAADANLSGTDAATTAQDASVPSATDADAVSETAALLQAYYEENYNASNTGRAIRDLNGDGQEDMLVVTYMEDPTGMLMGYTLLYFTVKDGAVAETDRFSAASIDPSLFTDDMFGKEELTVHISDSGYIAVLLYNAIDSIPDVSYLILSVKDGKLTVERHLWDPGYTSGLGLYTYDSYFDRESEPEKLFESDWTDVDADSRYDSYFAALEGELGGYGFTFEQYREEQDPNFFMQKGQVAADGTEQLLDFRNFRAS